MGGRRAAFFRSASFVLSARALALAFVAAAFSSFAARASGVKVFFAFVFFEVALRRLDRTCFSAGESPEAGLAAAFFTARFTGREGSPTTFFGLPGVA